MGEGTDPASAGLESSCLGTSGSITWANTPLPSVRLSSLDFYNCSPKPIFPLQHPVAPIFPRY